MNTSEKKLIGFWHKHRDTILWAGTLLFFLLFYAYLFTAALLSHLI